MMSRKFRGSYDKLRKCVARTRFYGAWRELPNSQRQYRTGDGAVLNWWESSGTINFQGTDPKKAFESAFIAEAEAKRRLISKDAGPVTGPAEQRNNVRRRIEQAQTDIARLKWRALQSESHALQILIADRLDDVAKIISQLGDCPGR
jgi:hypothetical protein